MNPNTTDKGLGTSPEKEASISSVAMENQQQSKPKASQAAAPNLTTNIEDADDAKGPTSPKTVTSTTALTGIEPQVPATKPSFEHGTISSSESSEYEDDLPLPNFPYRPSETSLTHNIGPQTWTLQAMGNKEAEFPTTSFGQKGLSRSPDVQHKGVPKTAASAIGVDTKILPGISPLAKAAVPDNTGKFPLTSNAPTIQGVNTKVLPSIKPIAEATLHDTTGKSQFAPNSSIPESVDTKISPSIDPIVKATVPDTINKFQFTLSTPIPQQPVQSSAAIPFLFTREAKAPLKAAQFGPVKRRVVKSSRMEEEDDDAPKFPPMIFNLPESFDFMPQDKEPTADSKFLPVKSSLAEAFTIAPENKTPAEDFKFLPVKSSSAEDFTIAPQATTKPVEEQKVVPAKAPKKPDQEPRSIPVNATIPDTGKFPLTLNAPILQDVKTKILPGLDTIAKATAPETTGKFPLPLYSPVSQDVDLKILPGLNPIVKAIVPDTTDKLQVTLNTSTSQSMNPSIIPSMNPIANTTAPAITTKVPFKLKPAISQSMNRKTLSEMNTIAEASVPDTTKFPLTLNTAIPQGVDTKILPGIDPIVKATVPDTISKFQFTLSTSIPQQPVQPSAAKPFLFTREAKQSLKEAQYGPVKRRLVPSRMEDDDDDAPKFPPMIFNLPESFDFTPKDKKPVEDPKFLPVKSSLAEAFTIAPQTATKLAEEQKVMPVKATLARPPTHKCAPKKPIQEPQPTPVKSSVAKKSVFPQKTRQSTALPEFPETKLSVETESTQPTAQKVERQQGKFDEDKKAQVIRELLDEKIELRSQRNALAMEKAALEAKLEGQAQEEEEGRKALSARNDQQARELEKLRARLVEETAAKDKATSRANSLQKTINQQVDALREVGVEKAKLQTTVENQKAELAKSQREQTGLQAKADIGLANAVMEGERAKVEEEDKRREGRALATLENLREEGKRSRQILMDELEAKDAELHEAKNEVMELGQKLRASSQATAEALVAASASNVPPSSPSPPPQISIPAPPPSSAFSTTMPWFQLNLSPRRFLIFLFLFLLAFAIPLSHFNPLSQPAPEERGWSTEVVGPRYQRIIQEAQILEMWEQKDPVMTAEEGWRRTREAAWGYDEGF